jgi:surface polysaccharide O-acyltransferase-like enzyme
MGFVTKKNFNILFIVVVIILFISIFNRFNEVMNALKNGEPPPKRLIQRTLSTHFEK